ncbi:MAG: phosphoribosylformylglycinamidine synthase subunit PurL, partial [Actinomycetota bacterium]|nr:phosphoribosylformylglycinamidine synthase subunit PurL [Actinomycetota bacterium]
LASSAFEEGSETKRPSVQVGDPFTEKLLIEACLELIERGVVVGIQDLGGAGICCATSESAANAGTGMRIHLENVPRRERGMEPFEILTSESQERMLVIVTPEDEEEALATCRRWGLGASVIGQVTASGRLEVFEDGVCVADVPAASLGDGPVYYRPVERPHEAPPVPDTDVAPPEDLRRAVLALAGDPSLCSKRWVWEQYDHQVMLGTVTGPGADAAVLRLPGARKRIAVTADANGRWCAADPYLGTCHAVAEAARNLSVVGAEPIAVTNCLNFGNPERADVMWAFSESVRGLGDACTALGTPVTGGNVSFYNETAGRSIDPTPVVGMVGVVADAGPPGTGFRGAGHLIVLLGETLPELAGSEFLRIVHGRPGGLPSLDLGREAALGRVVRGAIARGLLASAHDCSEGGLALALTESCLARGLGAAVTPEDGLPVHVWLFSETAGRVLASVEPHRLPALRALAAAEGVPVSFLGTVGGDALRIGSEADIPVAVLRDVYENALPGAMKHA